MERERERLREKEREIERKRERKQRKKEKKKRKDRYPERVHGIDLILCYLTLRGTRETRTGSSERKEDREVKENMKVNVTEA